MFVAGDLVIDDDNEGAGNVSQGDLFGFGFQMPDNFDFPDDLIMELRSGSNEGGGPATDAKQVRWPLGSLPLLRHAKLAFVSRQGDEFCPLHFMQSSRHLGVICISSRQ